MKVSVLIVAHHEEQYIEKCISSVLHQTKKPDEIVLVVHNSTDRTLERASRFPITVIPFQGPHGVLHARLEGIKHVHSDMVLCTDGDSMVKENWVEIMSETLTYNNNILVGSWIQYKGTWYGWLSNIFNKYYCIRGKEKVERWIWGASFGFWNKDKDFVKEVLGKSTELSEQLKLSRNPEDYWLALFMKQKGNLEVTNKTSVTVHTKEVSSTEASKRNLENIRNGNIMEDYFKNLH